MIPPAKISEISLSIHVLQEVLFEPNREGDACDVIVRMDDGTVYTATFVTLDYLRRQMDLSYQVTEQIDDTPAVRYAAIDTMHIVVETLIKDIIEDTIDNLIALDVFESYFIRVTESTDDEDLRTKGDGKLATQEVAAVVISDVLVVQR
jgi:hypothetical protein